MRAKVVIEIFIDDYGYESSKEEREIKLESVRIAAEAITIPSVPGYSLAYSTLRIEEILRTT